MRPIVPANLPPELVRRTERVVERLAAIGVDSSPEVAKAAVRVAIASEFAVAAFERDPAALLDRIADASPLTLAALARRLDLDTRSEPAALAALRRLRRVELARIAWRDLAGLADLDASLADLSTLADFAVAAALDYAAAALARRMPAPRDAHGTPLPLLVLAMGKLGGAELNFSSDIDLVFAYPETEDLDEDGRSACQEYFVRLAQSLIKLLDSRTEDGFVFRVDARLRPFGASGPLVVSLPALETYLVQHGREWERYAYVKARLLTGHEYRSAVFDEILTPFVYRRYLDYGVFESLRMMKKLIAAEVARKDMAENIKLGPGGIREIEFIVQALQLVRGGRRADLRTRSLLQALPLLAGERQLGAAAVTALAAGYRFLRTLENRLQALDDRQTHELPHDAETRARLAYAMGERDWPSLYRTLERHRAAVQTQFERIAWDTASGAGRTPAAERTAAWEAGAVAELLKGGAFARDAEIAAPLEELRRSGLYRRMDEVSRQRLAAVVVRTLTLLESQRAPAKALARVLPIYRAVARRSAYLALLNENPAALERLLGLAADSAWIVRQIAEHPMLLDELLDARLFETPPTRAELEALFERELAHVDRTDTEAVLEAIRAFQRTATFLVALADRSGALPLMKVSDRLTDTAELVLQFALDTAWRELVVKFGRPLCGTPPNLVPAGFAVIGYGKLGGLELGYASDLDVVFLHDSAGSHQETDGTPPIDNERFFVRLVQRLIHFLTIQTTSGRLYEVDTRLRPSGRSGLLVSSLARFRRYQTTDAWVWEHQALLRSRALAGSRAVSAAFERIRREVLVGHVDRTKLKPQIAEMRARMRIELSLGKGERFDLKQDPGGIADIEFLVDYWVLANAGDFPELVEFPDNIRQLEALERTGLVPPERCMRLRDAYLELRRRTHELALDEAGRVVADDELVEVRAFVTSIWREVFG